MRPVVTKNGFVVVLVLPLLILVGIVGIGSAMVVRTYCKIQTQRHRWIQARWLARSGLDIKTQYNVPLQELPNRWDTPTLLSLSTALPVDVDGEIRLIQCPSDWIAIGKYRDGVAVLRQTVATPTHIVVVNPD